VTKQREIVGFCWDFSQLVLRTAMKRLLVCGILLIFVKLCELHEEDSREVAVISNKREMTAMMDEKDKSAEEMEEDETLVDFRTHLITKIFLTVVIYKAIATTFVLFILVAILPALNPDFLKK
jgi:hypothetical protein